MTIKMIPHYNLSGQSDQQQGPGPGQVKLCNLRTIQESHEKEIYCIAWSKDVHQETTRLDDDDDQHMSVRSFSNNDDDSSADASAGDVDVDSRRTLLFRYMATCAGRHLCVYQVPIIETNGNTNMTDDDVNDDDDDDDVSDDTVPPELEMIQSYMDSDTEEEFYSCVFAGRSNSAATVGYYQHANNSNINHHHQYLSGETGNGPQLLCVAGLGRTIKVIDTVRQELVATLRGHGRDIYDLKPSPINDFMLLSASKDRSIRLWNLKTGAMVAIFAGQHYSSHCDDIVSLSWHVSGHRFVSSGMDQKILIWNVGPGTEVYNAIQSSHQTGKRLFEKGQRDNETPVQCITPIFATSEVHLNCVDCVQFVGDLILSRGSLDGTIVLWEPVMPDPFPGSGEPVYPIPSHFEHLRTFEGLDDADFWFIRFGTDASHGHKTLACGNYTGDIFLWDIDAETGEIPFLKLNWTNTNTSKGKKRGGIDKRKKRTAPTAVPRAVRWVSFSPDGNLFIASSDEGKLYVWDVVR